MTTDLGPNEYRPRWPAMLALLAIGGLQFALPESFSLGPRWLLLVFVAVLVVATVSARYRGHHPLNQILGFTTNAVVTADLAWSLSKLVLALPSRRESPRALLASALVVWITNILVFASWYWRLDAGGPRARELQGAHTDGAFLFPQMTLSKETRDAMGESTWNPRFVDYFFLAFNTSTAFSPTDVPILSRWAKALMMVQASISFATVALLAARAVNIL